MAGLLLAGAGVRFVYGWTWPPSRRRSWRPLIGPQPPQAGAGQRPGWAQPDRPPSCAEAVIRDLPVRHQRHGVRHAARRVLALVATAFAVAHTGFLYAAPELGPCSARSPPDGSTGSGGRAARSSSLLWCGARRSSSASRWLPAALVLLAWRAGPTSSGGVPARSPSPCPTRSANADGHADVIVTGGPRIGNAESVRWLPSARSPR